MEHDGGDKSDQILFPALSLILKEAQDTFRGYDH